MSGRGKIPGKSMNVNLRQGYNQIILVLSIVAKNQTAFFRYYHANKSSHKTVEALLGNSKLSRGSVKITARDSTQSNVSCCFKNGIDLTQQMWLLVIQGSTIKRFRDLNENLPFGW